MAQHYSNPTDVLSRYRDDNGRLIAYAWPGGYPMHYMCADGAVLCPPCANGENGSDASTHPDTDAQWRLVAAEPNWEDPSLYCEHCNKRIESAYADDDSDEQEG